MIKRFILFTYRSNLIPKAFQCCCNNSVSQFSLALGDTYETLLWDHENPGSTLFILIDLVHISLGLYFVNLGAGTNFPLGWWRSSGVPVKL